MCKLQKYPNSPLIKLRWIIVNSFWLCNYSFSLTSFLLVWNGYGTQLWNFPHCLTASEQNQASLTAPLNYITQTWALGQASPNIFFLVPHTAHHVCCLSHCSMPRSPVLSRVVSWCTFAKRSHLWQTDSWANKVSKQNFWPCEEKGIARARTPKQEHAWVVWRKIKTQKRLDLNKFKKKKR